MCDEGSLDYLAKKYRTDKRKEKRNFAWIYERHFKDRKSKNINLLEIGVHLGRSLRMWKDYFVNGNIYGIDVNPTCKSVEQDRIIIFIGDQRDHSFLDSTVNEITGGLDIIIDDGCHFTSSQKETFKYLFPHLNSGGIYVTEDTDSSYRIGKHRDNQWSIKKEGSFMEYMKSMVDVMHFKRHNIKSHVFDGQLFSIHFYFEMVLINKDGQK